MDTSVEFFFSIASFVESFLVSSANPTDLVVAGSDFFSSPPTGLELPNEKAGLVSVGLELSLPAVVALEPNEKPGLAADEALAAGVPLEVVDPKEKPGFEVKLEEGLEDAGAIAFVLVLVDPKEKPEAVSFFSCEDEVVVPDVAGVPDPAKDDDPKLKAGLDSSFFGSEEVAVEPNENAGLDSVFFGSEAAGVEPKENAGLDSSFFGSEVGAEEPNENAGFDA